MASDPYVDSLIGRLLPTLLAREGRMLSIKDIANGTYVHVNNAMAAWLGMAPAEIAGRTDIELFDPAIVTMLRAAEQTALAQSQPVASEHRFEFRGERADLRALRFIVGPELDGRHLLATIWTDQSAQRQKDEQLRAALEQLESLQRSNQQLRSELQEHAPRDARGEPYTHAHFDEQLRREVDLSTREHREFALVYVEIDPPGERELALGARAHERIVDALGRLLRGKIRAMDASCRLDERRFAVLLSGVGLATAHGRVEGLRRECVTQIVMLDGEELRFTASMGIASFPHTANSQEELLAAARRALDEARRRGGNHVALAGIRFEPVK